MPVVPITGRVAHIAPPDDHRDVVLRGRRRTTVSAVLGLLAHLPRRCADLPRAARRLADPAPPVRDRHRARRDHQRDLVDADPAVRSRGAPLARAPHRSRTGRGASTSSSAPAARTPPSSRTRSCTPPGCGTTGAVEVYVLDDRGVDEIRCGGRSCGGPTISPARPGVDEEVGQPALRVRAVVGRDRPRARRRLRGPARLPRTDAAVLRRRRARHPADTAVLPHVERQLGRAGRRRPAGAVLPHRPARPRPSRRRDLRRDERPVPPLGARRARAAWRCSSTPRTSSPA